MSNYKPGLHKDISAIFNSAPLPKNDAAQKPSAVPAPPHQDYSASKPPAPQMPSQKPPAPSHMTPTKPKIEPPKAAAAKQPKSDGAVKTAGQVPWQKTLEKIKSKLLATKSGDINSKQKMMAVLAPVLFVVLIFLFVRAFSTPSRKITGPEASEAVKAVAGADTKVEWQVPAPYPTTLRDPMQFGSSRSQSGAGGIIVKGIVFSKDNPSTLIGDKIMHQGDKILDVTITKINENNVEFEEGGKKWTQNVQR